MKGISSQAQGTLNPYGYTGRETDMSDLYYYRARYYDPHAQRFISMDPIEFESGDFNHYRYVGNDPVNLVDPTGLEEASAGDIIKSVAESLATKDIPFYSTAAVMGDNAEEVVDGIRAIRNIPKRNEAQDKIIKELLGKNENCTAKKITKKIKPKKPQSKKYKTRKDKYCECMEYSNKYEKKGSGDYNLSDDICTSMATFYNSYPLKDKSCKYDDK